MKYLILSALFLSLCYTSIAQAQCSDAGVCELSRHDITLKEPTLLVNLRYSLGTSGKPENIGFQQVSGGLEYHLTKNIHFITEVPYRVQTFSNRSISGFGDVFLIGKYSVSTEQELNGLPKGADIIARERDDHRFTTQIGVKLPTGSVNEGSLPTTYQNGLGTTDLLLGIQYSKLLRVSDITAGIGMQIPFGKSANSIDHLERGADLLVQGAYTRKWENIFVTGQLLAILPLKKSVINQDVLQTDETSPDPYWAKARNEVPNSDKLQVNFLLSAAYSFNEVQVSNWEWPAPY